MNADPTKIPMILVSQGAWSASGLFNPNEWEGISRGIVLSCHSEFGVLVHCRDRIVEACQNSQRLCDGHMRTLKSQWRAAKFELSRVDVFGEVPDLHIWIEAFLSGVKTLLDLLAQLLPSERVVAGPIDGFHREKDVYGANVLNSLSNNATAPRKEVANQIGELIRKEKSLWIDQAIEARDLLTHPPKGLRQLMFRLELSEGLGDLTCDRIVPPTIADTDIPVDEYVKDTVAHAQKFILEFVRLLRKKDPAEQGKA